MATVTAFETVWNNSTNPKTVNVTGAVTGDKILVIAQGNKTTTNAVSDVVTSTTAGTTGTWTDPVLENLAGGTSGWYSTALVDVTGDGTVTVQVDRTQAPTPQEFGFAAFLLNGYGTLGTNGVTSDGAVEVINLTVEQDSAVFYGATEWDTHAVGSTWTPSGQTVVENAAASNYSSTVAYWTAQAAGTRDYGTTDSAGTSIRIVAIEVLIAAAPPPELEEGPQVNVTRSSNRFA